MLRGIKKLLSGLLVIGLVGSMFAPAAYAETGQLKSQQSQIQQQRSQLKSELTAAEKEVAKVLAEIDSLNEQIEQNNQALEENQKMIEETEKSMIDSEKELVELEKEIKELEKDIDFRKELLKERAVTYQKNGTSVNYLQVVLGAKSFSDFIGRIYNVSQIAQADSNFLETLNNNMAKVEEKKASLEAKLEELKELSVELEGMKLYLKEQIEANNELKKELKKKEEENRGILQQLKDKDSKLAKREAEIRASIRSAETRKVQLPSRSTTPNNAASKSSSQPAVIASGSAQDVINIGKQFIGRSRYVFAARDPVNGRFDCSGFTGWAFSQIGVNIGYSTAHQSTVGKRVSYSEAKPGDLIFFNTYKTNGHVGIYLGNGQFLGSQNSTGVAIADVNSPYWKKRFTGHVRRVLN